MSDPKKPQPQVKCAGCARRRENIRIAAIKVMRKIKGRK